MTLDVDSQTSAAALAGRDRLASLARTATGERSMASFAPAALFEEALLAAMRSRFNELRAVAK